MHTPTARNTRPASFGGSTFRAGNQFVQPARPAFPSATSRMRIPPVRYVRPVSTPVATRLARAIGRRAIPGAAAFAVPYLIDAATNAYLKKDAPEGAVKWSEDATYVYYLGARDTFNFVPSFVGSTKSEFSENWPSPGLARFKKVNDGKGHYWLENIRYENSGNIAVYAYSGWKAGGTPIETVKTLPYPSPRANPFIRSDPRITPQYRFLPDPRLAPGSVPEALAFDFGFDGSVSIRPTSSPGKRPPRRVKESKAARRALVGVVSFLTHMGSEAAEVIDTLYFYARGVRRELDEPGVWRVPRGVDGSAWSKLMYVIRHSDNIDWSQALPHVLVEQMILDKIIGRTIGAADNRFRDINDYSVSPQFGPAL